MDKNLIISLTCNEYDNFSHKFKDEIMPVLIDLKTMSAMFIGAS